MPRFCPALLAPLAFLLFAGPLPVWAQSETDEQDPPPAPVAQNDLEAVDGGSLVVEQDAIQEYTGEEIAYDDEAYEEDGEWEDVRWTLQVDALILRRSSRDGQPLVVDGAAPYRVSDLDLPFRFGPRVSIIRHGLLGSMWDAEVTYFGIDGWSDQVTSTGATQFVTNPTINFLLLDVTARYNSSLYSTEVNLRRRLGNRFTLITGFRWIELRDNLFTDLGGIASHTVNVNNHLYGWQIGTDAWLVTIGRFDLSGWVKAGLYGNAADQTTTIVGVGGAVPNFGARGGRTAFAGEVGLTGTYWINDWLAGRIGYQALWLDSMATAAPQLPVSDVTTGVSVLNFSDTLLYHGGFFGLEATW